MPISYLPLLILFVIILLFAIVAIGFPTLLGPRRTSKIKVEPYESGLTPFVSPRRRFPIHYYMTAVLFMIFDVEVIFLFPWAVLAKKLKVFGLVEIGLFFLILIIGYIYAWRKDAFTWER